MQHNLLTWVEWGEGGRAERQCQSEGDKIHKMGRGGGRAVETCYHFKEASLPCDDPHSLFAGADL
jgi:hypothetical protein